jgi:hypothetical protein
VDTGTVRETRGVGYFRFRLQGQGVDLDLPISKQVAAIEGRLCLGSGGHRAAEITDGAFAGG